MLSRFSKKASREISGNKTIAFFNPFGSDTTPVAVGFAKYLFEKNTSYKSLLCEFPCLGIPRLSFEVADQYTKEKSMDQLLLDYDRDSLKSLDTYIMKSTEFDMLPVYEKSKPEYPTFMNLSKEELLMEVPGFLKSQLQPDYKFLIYTLQGQLFHTLTFYSLRYADFVVIYLENSKELPWAYMAFTKLTELFGVPKDSIALYAPRSFKEFKEETVLFKFNDLLSKVGESEWQPQLSTQQSM